ncbi:MAG TPA: potassium channel family protein [Terriglobales bacterium]|nr:potassium channel family protein [Terriglobales bacterium]
MKILALVAGSILVFVILLDAFETIVLPRRVTRSFRFTALFYRFTWRPWAAMARFVPAPRRRESYLSYFGPLSLIVLLGLWAFALIVGFALLQYGAGTRLQAAPGSMDFGGLLYFSGTTFFTLGYGDVVPLSGAARALAVLESGVGFGFLAMVIGYLPVIYSSFSRREVEISLLDARAGSPPSAQEFLSRMAGAHNQPLLDRFLHEWEHWAAEVLESHISYPVLGLFRSQHINQSWLGSLTTILDVSALTIVGIDGIASNQARLTFAMARHAVVDLAQVVGARYDAHATDRLSAQELVSLRQALAANGLQLRAGEEADRKLLALRSMYEPYVQALADRLLLRLPEWGSGTKAKDNWRSSPWDKLIAKQDGRVPVAVVEEHF